MLTYTIPLTRTAVEGSLHGYAFIMHIQIGFEYLDKIMRTRTIWYGVDMLLSEVVFTAKFNGSSTNAGLRSFTEACPRCTACHRPTIRLFCCARCTMQGLSERSSVLYSARWLNVYSTVE